MSNQNILPPLCKFLKKILNEGYVTSSNVGVTLKKDETFKTLVASEAIIKKRKGAGWIWESIKIDVVKKYLTHKCPSDEIDEARGDRFNNINMFRNSKSRNRESYRLIFTRSKESYLLNNETLTDTSMDAVGKRLNTLSANKVCFVENLENFMNNKYFIENGWVLVYVIGRIGKPLLDRIHCKEIIHFGDLDYIGLNEYATIKESFPNASLYVPKDYFKDAMKRGKTITSKQQASDSLLSLVKKDSKVKEILDFLHKENLFLEQEGYRDD